MARLSLPLPSPVPLSVLRESISEHAAAPHGESRWWTRNTSTRLARRCREYRIDAVWMLALHSRYAFRRIRNAGRRTENLADEVLAHVGCTIGMFPELFVVLEEVGKSARRDDGVRISFFEVLLALAGVGDWAKDGGIAARLAEHGLRPGMPLEELFVYGSTSGDPKVLTVTEELLAFGALQAVGVLPAESMEGLPSDTTMIEVMTILSASEDWFGYGSLARDRFVRAARERLSSEALIRLNISIE